MKIAIVEDNCSDRAWLLECLERYETEHNLKFEITQFEDGDRIVTSYCTEYDVILMDIEMQFMDGMSAAREIRKTDSKVIILFITNAPQYVMKGYEVDALDYLLKPVSYFSLEKRLDRAMKQIEREKRTFLRLNVKGGFQRVDANRIRYIETDGQGLIYHTRDGNFRTWDSLHAAEEMLDGRLFFRCNKCYLVNLNYVDSLIGRSLCVDGEVIQVSRSRKKPLLDALNLYMSETEL